jgi:Leucine-rich repeat (LRR) protein
MQTLIAHTNLMEKVPDDLAKLKNMEILVLSFNSFSEFPAVVCDMAQACLSTRSQSIVRSAGIWAAVLWSQYELVERNYLVDLIHISAQLEQLSLAGNDITVIPEAVGKMTKLRKVSAGHMESRRLLLYLPFFESLLVIIAQHDSRY